MIGLRENFLLFFIIYEFSEKKHLKFSHRINYSIFFLLNIFSMITMRKDGKKPSISSNDITMRFLFLNRNPLNRFFF